MSSSKRINAHKYLNMFFKSKLDFNQSVTINECIKLLNNEYKELEMNYPILFLYSLIKFGYHNQVKELIVNEHIKINTVGCKKGTINIGNNTSGNNLSIYQKIIFSNHMDISEKLSLMQFLKKYEFGCLLDKDVIHNESSFGCLFASNLDMTIQQRLDLYFELCKLSNEQISSQLNTVLNKPIFKNTKKDMIKYNLKIITMMQVCLVNNYKQTIDTIMTYVCNCKPEKSLIKKNKLISLISNLFLYVITNKHDFKKDGVYDSYLLLFINKTKMTRNFRNDQVINYYLSKIYELYMKHKLDYDYEYRMIHMNHLTILLSSFPDHELYTEDFESLMIKSINELCDHNDKQSDSNKNDNREERIIFIILMLVYSHSIRNNKKIINAFMEDRKYDKLNISFRMKTLLFEVLNIEDNIKYDIQKDDKNDGENINDIQCSTDFIIRNLQDTRESFENGINKLCSMMNNKIHEYYAIILCSVLCEKTDINVCHKFLLKINEMNNIDKDMFYDKIDFTKKEYLNDISIDEPNALIRFNDLMEYLI